MKKIFLISFIMLFIIEAIFAKQNLVSINKVALPQELSFQVCSISEKKVNNMIENKTLYWPCNKLEIFER